MAVRAHQASKHAGTGGQYLNSLLFALFGFCAYEVAWLLAHGVQVKLVCSDCSINVRFADHSSKPSGNSTQPRPTMTSFNPNLTSSRWVPLGKKIDFPKRTRVAVIVPYRNRTMQLKEFLARIHPFLVSQRILYEVFIVEQAGKSMFNRGALFNIGVAEINLHLTDHGQFQCIVLHDVDLIPLEPANSYDCLATPGVSAWQLSSAIDIYNWDLPFPTTAGGVNMFTVDKYLEVGGFSNRFFGWGGEDDDLMHRLRAHNSFYKRRDKSVGLYRALKAGHTVGRKNPVRFDLLRHREVMVWREGLQSIKYRLQARQVFPDHTRLLVDIWPHEDEDVFSSDDINLSEEQLRKKYNFKPPPDVNQEHR